MIVEKFAGRCILITGVTGFLGKVILEKILRSIPQVGRILLLIRPKKDTTPHQRLKKLIQSRIFNRIRSERPDFEEYALSKLQVLPGDVSRENLGLSDEDIALIQAQVNVIIHSAATVNFTEPLPEALSLNVLGTLRLFAIAKGCKKIECFTHISTTFVNCDKRGQVDEILYPLDFDPNATLQELLEMDPKQVLQMEEKLIAGFPNTYTFTKSITEHLLVERRGDIPLLIFRPSIIGAAYKEPTPGWLDTVSAASALYVTTGMGIMKFMLAHRPSRIGDQVPADIVSNSLIAATADIIGENRLNIIQVGTSKNKPLTWRYVKKTILPYLLRRPPKRTFSKPTFMFVTSDWVYNSLYFFQYRVPIAGYKLYARMLGTDQQLKEAQMWGTFEKRIRKMVGNFNYFVNNEWIFDTTNTYEVWNKLSEQEQLEFPFDITQIDWEEYLLAFCYGMKLNILREEDTVYPPADRNCPMYLRADLGADFMWAFTGAEGVNDLYKINTPESMAQIVLDSERVQAAINKEADEESVTPDQVRERAEELLQVMAGSVNMGLMRTEGYFFRKFYRYMYQGIFVDHFGIKRVAEAAKKGPILLVPTHRSYLDFLLTSFVFHDHDLPVPRIASGDDFLNMALVSWIFRNSGAFFMRRSYGKDELYRAIFAEYVQQIVRWGHPLEFFIEGTRSRTGKTLPPKFGLLATIVNGLLQDGQIENVTICPITISYERLVEEQSHAHELAGQPKEKPTTTALIQAAFGKLLHQNYGRINIQFAEPIEINQYIHSFADRARLEGEANFDPYHNRDNLFAVVESLGHEVVESFHREMVLMATQLVSAILLAFRSGISKDLLCEKFGWLREQLIARSVRIDPIEGSNEEIVDHSLALLNGLVLQKRNIIELEIVAGQKNIHVLQLAMYRNGILHALQREGIAAITLASFGDLFFSGEGVPMEDFLAAHNYLSDLFVEEFVDRFRNKFARETLETMQKFHMVVVEKDKRGKERIRFVPARSTDNMFDFLCESFGPFVESYWLTATTLFSLQNKRTGVLERVLIERVQWFGEKTYFERFINYFEATCKESIRSALKIFTNMDAIHTNESSSITLTISFEQNPNRLQDLVASIDKYRKPIQALPQAHTRLGAANFPVLAKL